MPPPLRCASLIPSTSSCAKQCYRSSQSRTFSSSPTHDQRVTRNRRALFRWLNKVGVNFENPAEGSTNYLSAYTAEGVLRRSLVDDKGGDSKDTSNKGKVLPPEKASDLRPFPLNRDFRSQPVLSEELREAIWERIIREGKSVRDVS